ncbi:hypothetical protein Taro_050302 [Colocasia esculenta]|uniref:Uncharacterized protein n=1 Tax=Colocasia esculenta TaxID=4460 RepID=A0A843XDH1_COLES|nr:hypothetical protein [Colocasia esculenta]
MNGGRTKPTDAMIPSLRDEKDPSSFLQFLTGLECPAWWLTSAPEQHGFPSSSFTEDKAPPSKRLQTTGGSRSSLLSGAVPPAPLFLLGPLTMPGIATLCSTAAALPSLALSPTRHRRRPHPSRQALGTHGLPPPALFCVFVFHVKPHATMSDIKKASSLLLQCGALMAFAAEPALALTGNNKLFDDDLPSLLIQAAIVAVGYLLVMPPVIFNWLRLRWYKRKFFEMYLQFMFVFIFFPG